VLKELGIELICANTPQGKGRVERLFQTLQDRLVKELRLQNISNIEDANAFLPTFMASFNQRFSVDPAKAEDAHRKVVPSDEVLDLLLTVQSKRRLSKNLELSYQNVIYQIQVPGQGLGLRRAVVTVCDDQKGGITLLYRNRRLTYKILEKRSRPAEVVDAKRLEHHLETKIRQAIQKPKADHPWRRYRTGWLKSSSTQATR
jgi:hypothetical protein